MAQAMGSPPESRSVPGPTAVADRLESFSGVIADSRQEDFAGLISGIRSPNLGAAAQWAHIDLVAAFDPQTAIPGHARASGFWRGVATFGMFVPLILTWFGLHEAIKAYESLPPQERAGTFFENWIAGFSGSSAGILGSLNNLKNVSALTAAIFGFVILAGWLSESSSRKVDEMRNGLRGALTDAMRLLDVTFPESSADSAAVMADLADRLAQLTTSLKEAQAELLDVQRDVHTEISQSIQRMTGELREAFTESIAAIDSVSAEYRDRLRVLFAETLDSHRTLLESTQSGLAQCTAAMIQSGELVASMGEVTELNLTRRMDYDRIMIHVSDSALALREAVDQLSGITNVQR